MLAGSKEFIEEAWRFKQRFGGAMRQAGIIAAACVYALEHNVERLAEDHENAAIVGAALQGVSGLRIEPVETNIVIFDVAGIGKTAAEVAARLESRGVKVSTMGASTVRAVTHLDVSRADAHKAAEVLAATLSAR